MNRVATSTVALFAFGSVLATAPSADAATAPLEIRAMNVAKAQKNDPYRDRAEGPNAFDCSGLTFYSYKQSGKTLPRTAQGQYNASRKVSLSNRRVGDLVFIGYNNSSSQIKHVGIYIGMRNGKGYMINANSGSYRGYRVVEAPIGEYVAGSKKAFYGTFRRS